MIMVNKNINFYLRIIAEQRVDISFYLSKFFFFLQQKLKFQ